MTKTDSVFLPFDFRKKRTDNLPIYGKGIRIA